ncbi:hypothetical protein B296_00009341 [Ensete ventricosum]|uniref:Uncharacterized protein n=1 Tax=Ensete ventricosum TaxID=4639 RepID=A0A427AYE4_ENSVE|nr:hypothetical protein B296_00009341 [Ensete ventricosum]
MLIVVELSMVAEVVASPTSLTEVEVGSMLANACICWVSFMNASAGTSRWLDGTPEDEGLGLLNEHLYYIGIHCEKDLIITDMETYAIASEESINAKLEDRIRALFAEFNLGRPLSPRRSQQGESSYYKYDFQEKGGAIMDPHYPRMRMDFPR